MPFVKTSLKKLGNYFLAAFLICYQHKV